MTKIFLITNEEQNTEKIEKLLEKNRLEFLSSVGKLDDTLTQIQNFEPDVILIDNKIQNCEFTIRQLKAIESNQNTQIILLLEEKESNNSANFADGIIVKPIKEHILMATINSHSKIKKTFDRLYENNKELSRSLYQLNVLYNTSSQFTGTLNTNKLYKIMIEAMEKTLSFDISSVLIFNSLTKPNLNINTIHSASSNLIDALKIRSILNYKTTIENSDLINDETFYDLEINHEIKQIRSNKIYGLEAISFDSLFAPIKVGEDFFGVIEIFRKTKFSPEDVTCFQALAHQVALPLRSAKLYEEISITNKKLEKLEKLKSEFVSIVSHELRTPLTPINNSLEIVLNEQTGPISPEAKNFITMAKRNIHRLSGIIEDLLDLSRIQTGKMDFKYKPVEIGSSLELLEKTFLQVAKEKNIDFKLNIETELPKIYADTRRIEQIFSNLVSNSLKFTPQGGTIEINAKTINSKEIKDKEFLNLKTEIKGDYIQISVKDNGIGIKKEDIPKIFDKFSQIESSLNRNKGGVGLGLTITKQLIDSHLGAIWVESEEKAGSCFNVILPLLDTIKMFEMDLSREISNNKEVGALSLKGQNLGKIIEELKTNKILHLTGLSKEYFIKEENKEEYFAYIPNITASSFDIICQNIKEYINNLNINEKMKCDFWYDIIFKKIHNSKDGNDLVKLFKILNS